MDTSWTPGARSRQNTRQNWGERVWDSVMTRNYILFVYCQSSEGTIKPLKLNVVELQKVSIDESLTDDHWTFNLTWYETPFILRRLARNYLPKKKEEDDYQFTATKAFKLMLNEINDLAGQHEVAGTFLLSFLIGDKLCSRWSLRTWTPRWCPTSTPWPRASGTTGERWAGVTCQSRQANLNNCHSL